MFLEFYLEDHFFAQKPIPSPISEEQWHNWFTQWLTDMTSGQTYELGLRLTDDHNIQKLNQQYRHKDQPTDVLAFATLDNPFPTMTPEAEPLYLGDIIISVETAQKQAKQQDHSLRIELAWLASHGFLHLLGWDHPNEARLQEMLYQQSVLLGQVGLIS